MSEVGALIIKLQAETAQFREDMGKVKGDLADLEGTSTKTGQAMDFSMRDARGSMMLLGEETGVRIPRHLQALIATIPGVGAAFAAMLPLVGIAAAVMVIDKVIDKMAKAKDMVAEFGVKWSETTSESANKIGALDVEILKLQDSTAKLYGRVGRNGPAIAAIEALEKINSLDKSILTAISDMEKLMKEQSIGTFDSLLTGKAGTGDIEKSLKPKMDAAKQAFAEVINAESKLELDTVNNASKAAIEADKAVVASKKAAAAAALAVVQAEANAQQKSLDDHVAAQVKAAGFIDASHEEQQKFLAKQTAEFKAQQSVAQQLVTGVQQKTQELQTQLGMEGALTQALKNQAAATTHKEDEAALKKANIERLRGWEASFKAAEKYLNLVRTEGEKRHGMGVTPEDLELLKAIDPVLASTLETSKKVGEELSQWDKYINQIAEDAANNALSGAIKDAQEKEQIAMQNAKNLEALHKQSAAQTAAADIAASQTATNAEVKAFQDRIKALDKYSSDYVKKVQDLEEKIREVTKKGEDQVTTIKQTAEQRQLMNTQQAEDRMYQAIATDVAKSIVMNQSLVQSFRLTGEQLAEGMIKNLIMMELTHDKEKLVNAKGAFDKSFNWASAWGGPIAGAIAGAASFAAVMAFEQGGKIPGEGAVPIVGHGGETVVTRALTDRVEQSEGKNSGGSRAITMHNTFAPSIHAVDAEGVDAMLKKHGAIFQRHITSVMRRANR